MNEWFEICFVEFCTMTYCIFLTTVKHKSEADWRHFCLFESVQRHFQQYFNYIVAVSFIGGGNRRTRRKSLICRKSFTNFITFFCTPRPDKKIFELTNCENKSLIELRLFNLQIFFYYIFFFVLLPVYRYQTLSHSFVHLALIKIRTHNICGGRQWVHR
jgi:hypothetical protein